MSRLVLFFEREPRGSEFRDLVNWLVPRSREFWLILREDRTPHSQADHVLASLSRWRISSDRVSEWPGTRLYSATATCYRHRCTPSPASALIELSEGLFDWQEPDLPEDLCFLASDQRPLLVSIAHEREAYLDLTAAEEAAFEKELPLLYRSLSRDELPESW